MKFYVSFLTSYRFASSKSVIKERIFQDELIFILSSLPFDICNNLVTKCLGFLMEKTGIERCFRSANSCYDSTGIGISR